MSDVTNNVNEEYPAILPHIQTSGYGYRPTADNIAKTTWGNGRVETRVMYTSTSRVFDCTLTLSEKELAIWEAWRYYKLKQVNPFRINLRDGTGYHSVIAKHLTSGEPRNYIDGFWHVTFPLLVDYPAIMSEAALDAALGVDPNNYTFGQEAQDVVNDWHTDAICRD